MNYISHHEVARQYNPTATADFLFGSFVTDLARMSRAKRLLIGLTNTELLAGIKFHNLTNKAFDEHPAISQLGENMTSSFREFLPVRTAMQSANAGKDLLFDGIQFAQPRIIEDLFTTLDSVLEGKVEFSGIDRPEPIIKAVTYLRSHGPPRYDNPTVLALALHRTLSKTHTPLTVESLWDVTRVFTTYQSTVSGIGPLAMSQTIENLIINN